MPIWHEEHRGYRISYQQDHFALIARPSSETVMEERPKAEPGEGRVELRQKTHAIIDADIAAHGMAA